MENNIVDGHQHTDFEMLIKNIDFCMRTYFDIKQAGKTGKHGKTFHTA